LAKMAGRWLELTVTTRSISNAKHKKILLKANPS